MNKTVFIASILLVVTGCVLWAQLTPEQIIKKAEYNQVHDTSKSTGKMIITSQFGVQEKTFAAVTEGEDNILITFTNVEEQGQKILRLKDEIYLYFPKAEGLLRLQGGALKESVMGSSFSYEDLTGEKGLLELYNVSFIKDYPVILSDIPTEIEFSEFTSILDKIGGKKDQDFFKNQYNKDEGKEKYFLKKDLSNNDMKELAKILNIPWYLCYHLYLKGKKSVAYPEQELWIDSNIFVVRKAVYKSLSGRALKELVVERIQSIGGKYVPVQFNMIDKLKKNSQTRFIIENLRINVALRPDEFSLERLSF